MASGDLVAGVTVAVVLLPQALAYAELAGVPPERGLVAGGIAAVLGGLAGSHPRLQTGPTALAALMTFGVLTGRAPAGTADFAALAAVLAVLVGLVRLLAGWLRLGHVSFLVSHPAILGLASGAGLLIVASQLPGLVGHPGVDNDPLGGTLALVTDLGGIQPAALAVGLASLAVMLVGLRVPRLPGALLALVVGGVLAGALGGVEVSRLSAVDLQMGLGAVEPGIVLQLVVPAVVLAFVGFAEVAAIARTDTTRERRPWRPDRELVGQGLACGVAGLAGGFPVSGSFSRSALNRMAGAESRWAGVVTGVLVLAVLPVVQWLPPIPRPALAAVVCVAGASLIDLGGIRRLFRVARVQAGVAVVTFVATILLSPRIDLAVVVGVAVAAGAHLFREERVHVHVREEGRTLRASLHGVLFYLSLPRVEQALADAVVEHPDAVRVVVDLSGVGRIDVSAAQTLSDVLDRFVEAGLTIEIEAIPAPAERILSRTVAQHHALPAAPRPPSSEATV